MNEDVRILLGVIQECDSFIDKKVWQAYYLDFFCVCVVCAADCLHINYLCLCLYIHYCFSVIIYNLVLFLLSSLLHI